MKKILIVSKYMGIGGAERALLGLLNSFNLSQYKIDLFLFRQEGELYSMIPKGINILPENDMKYLSVPIKKVIHDRKYKIFFGRLLAKVHSKIFNFLFTKNKENHIESTLSERYTYRFCMNSFKNDDYDLVISFLTPHYYSYNGFKGKIKVAWIHTDYSSIVTDNKIEYKMWKKFDYIASISDECTKSFLKRFPELSERIIRVDNIIQPLNIKTEANGFIPLEMNFSNGEIILCSVGRVSTAKNFDNIPFICRYILNKGVNIKWYIIGSGGIEELVKNKIREYSVEDNVIMLGSKTNPYPYIKACDIYVQPSRYEGKAVAVREAQILNKPVIITDFPTAHSQLINNYDGIIVPMDNIGCAEGIISVIKDKELQERLIRNTKNTDYSNSSEVEKIYKLMEE